MPTTGATPFAPSHPLIGASIPCAVVATLAAPTDDNQSMDVDISVTQLAAANATNIQLLKLSTSPPSSDISHGDKLRNSQDLAATNRFIIILDEKFVEKTWNPHQEGLSSVKSFPTQLLKLTAKSSLPNIP
jgi:hypothetical protein